MRRISFCLLCILLSLPLFARQEGESRIAVVLAGTPQADISITGQQLASILQRASDYMDDQFRGSGRTFRFEFAASVSLTREYGNESVQAGVVEALLRANQDVFFYDFEDVVVIFPESSIWPQHSLFSSSHILDGRTFSGYCAVSEEFLTAGALVHEYSHTLGLVDLYDVDGDNSLGLSKGLWGSLDLMDRGDKNDCGNTPAPYSSVCLNLLGLGTCDTLKVGSHILEPLSRSRRYLYCPGGKEGEFFLLECRDCEGWDKFSGGSGLLIYHIDRSDSPSGFSTMFSANLTARQRWTLDPPQVNCNPLHPCADLVCSNPDAKSVGEVFWKGGSFHSDTSPAFRYWDGTASPLALENISLLPDGAVGFNVIRPLELVGKTVLQDAAVLSWKTDPSLAARADSCVLSWSKGGSRTGSETILPSSSDEGVFSCIVRSLEPSRSYLSTSQYDFEIRLYCGASRYSLGFTVQMQIYDPRNPYPYIFVSVPGRMNDGTFREGTRLPLLLYNCPGEAEVLWYFDSEKLEKGILEIEHPGVLRAEILLPDGSVETLVKNISVAR